MVKFSSAQFIPALVNLLNNWLYYNLYGLFASNYPQVEAAVSSSAMNRVRAILQSLIRFYFCIVAALLIISSVRGKLFYHEEISGEGVGVRSSNSTTTLDNGATTVPTI